MIGAGADSVPFRLPMLLSGAVVVVVVVVVVEEERREWLAGNG